MTNSTDADKWTRQEVVRSVRLASRFFIMSDVCPDDLYIYHVPVTMATFTLAR